MAGWRGDAWRACAAARVVGLREEGPGWLAGWMTADAAALFVSKCRWAGRRGDGVRAAVTAELAASLVRSPLPRLGAQATVLYLESPSPSWLLTRDSEYA